MSEKQNFGFGKFIPGFDFLQDLAKGASHALPQMPNLSNWVAPTLNLEELEKRIGELKAVHFWLDQNSKALGATIQALEVQKMTLATLKGMNFNMGEVAKALKLQPADNMFGASGRPASSAVAAGRATSTAGRTPAKPKPARKTAGADRTSDTPAGGGVVDPLQWWGALTQQFQQIAAGALKDAATPALADGAAGAAVARASGADAKTSGASKGPAAPVRRPVRKKPHS